MRFSISPDKNQKQLTQYQHEQEDIVSISNSDIYTSSSVGDPTCDMEIAHESRKQGSSMCPTLHEDTVTLALFPTDVQSIIRHPRCTSDEFDVVFQQVGVPVKQTTTTDPQRRLFRLLSLPTLPTSNSSVAPSRYSYEQGGPSCFGSQWEVIIWSISVLFVISVTVVVCAVMYNRRIGKNATTDP